MDFDKETVLNYKLGVLYGDGIGSEIVKSSVEVLKAATKKAGNGTEFEFKELPMGWEGIKSIMIQYQK